MIRLSLAAVAATLATLVAGQEGLPSALPDVTTPAGMACQGCYVVADVAGIVFGGVQTATQTNVVSVGSNGSVVTTSIIIGQGQATFVSDAPVGGPTSFNPLSSVITVQGATLTSPTQYEVFSAFSVMSTVSGPNGKCVVSSGTRVQLSPASQYSVPANADSNFLLDIESSFINEIGFPECSAGGGSVQTTTHSMITTTTHSSTTTGLIRPTPVPQSVSSVASSTGSSSFIFPNITSSATQAIGTAPVGTGVFPSASVTIMPASNDAPRSVLSLPLAVVLAAGAALARWL